MEGHGAHIAPSLGDLVLPTINFALFVFLLVRFLRGPIREFFRARAERIRAELAIGDQARQEALDLRARLARDLAELPGTLERLKADLRETAERERDQMLAQGRQTAERIRADTKLLAEQELATARRAVRRDTVDEAIRVATALVREATGPRDQEQFVRTFIEAARPAS